MDTRVYQPRLVLWVILSHTKICQEQAFVCNHKFLTDFSHNSLNIEK